MQLVQADLDRFRKELMLILMHMKIGFCSVRRTTES